MCKKRIHEMPEDVVIKCIHSFVNALHDATMVDIQYIRYDIISVSFIPVQLMESTTTKK